MSRSLKRYVPQILNFALSCWTLLKEMYKEKQRLLVKSRMSWNSEERLIFFDDRMKIQCPNRLKWWAKSNINLMGNMRSWIWGKKKKSLYKYSMKKIRWISMMTTVPHLLRPLSGCVLAIHLLMSLACHSACFSSNSGTHCLSSTSTLLPVRSILYKAQQNVPKARVCTWYSVYAPSVAPPDLI